MNNETLNSGNDPVTSPQPKVTSASPKHNTTPLVLGFIVVVLLCSLGALVINQSTKISELSKKQARLDEKFVKLEETNNAAKTNNEDKVDKDKYQAVFLEGGQVYFGKITSITNAQIVLEDIYYLRTDQQATPQNLETITAGNDVSLVKLGNELHAPEDVMYIERKDTLFWENLKNDGQIAKAINEYKKANP